MAIARRAGHDKKIVLGDKSMDNCRTIAKIMNEAGFDGAALIKEVQEQPHIYRSWKLSYPCVIRG